MVAQESAFLQEFQVIWCTGPILSHIDLTSCLNPRRNWDECACSREKSTDQLPFIRGDSTESRGSASPLEIRSFTTPSGNPLQPATRCGHLPQNLLPGGLPAINVVLKTSLCVHGAGALRKRWRPGRRGREHRCPQTRARPLRSANTAWHAPFGPLPPRY